MINSEILKIKNIDEVSNNIQNFIKEQVFNKFKKRGVVVGISGGVDSALVATLCTKALGKENVLGIIMPEKESNQQSKTFAELLVKKLNIRSEIIDITSILESFKIYKIRESIIKKNFSTFDNKCKYRLVLSSNLIEHDNLNIPYLEIQDGNNVIHKIKLSLPDYLAITAATNIKHRTRMTLLYFYAEKNHYLVMGTTNKSEFVQGYFVKYGDGGVDVELLANLYKTQVYQLAQYLDVPKEILNRKASPDTWSFEVSDEEFFYSIPYQIIDLAWHLKEKNVSEEQIGKTLNLTEQQINRIINDQRQKWNASKHMREMPPTWNADIISLNYQATKFDNDNERT